MPYLYFSVGLGIFWMVLWTYLGGPRIKKCECGRSMVQKVTGGEIAIGLLISALLSAIALPLLGLVLDFIFTRLSPYISADF